MNVEVLGEDSSEFTEFSSEWPVHSMRRLGQPHRIYRIQHADEPSDHWGVLVREQSAIRPHALCAKWHDAAILYAQKNDTHSLKKCRFTDALSGGRPTDLVDEIGQIFSANLSGPVA